MAAIREGLAGQITVRVNRFTLHYPINDFTGHRRLPVRCPTLEAA